MEIMEIMEIMVMMEMMSEARPRKRSVAIFP